MTSARLAPPVETFEAQPRGWPSLRAVAPAYAVCLGLALLAPRVVIPGLWGDHAPLLPVALALAAFELVRGARWRTTRYVVIEGRLVVQRGLLGPATSASAPLAGARLLAEAEGARLETPDRVVRLEGLDALDREGLAALVAAAGGEVVPELARPARRAPSARQVAGATAALLAGAALIDLRGRVERARQLEFEACVVAVDRACEATATAVEPAVRAAWVVPAGVAPARVSWGWGDLARDFPDGDIDERVLSIAFHAERGEPDQRRVVRVRAVRPWRVIPTSTRLELRADDDPLARIVLDALRAHLDAAGLRYEVVVR